MISILTVNSNCLDWMRLLVASVRKFTHLPYEIILVDNGSEDGSVVWILKEQKGSKDIRAFILNKNLGHGAGLDFALQQAERRFCLVLDIDAHLQRKDWDFDLIELYIAKKERKLICAGGDSRKPIHPCFMFFEREFFLDMGLSFVPREGFDVGRKIYFDLLVAGYEVLRIPPGYESNKKKFYDGAWGDNYYIAGKPTIYHNWYSARMWRKNRVDNLTREEFERRKKILFEQPLVKEILSMD